VGPTVDALGTVYVAVGAVVLSLVAAWCWRAAWRRVRRRSAHR
jgi:hypothetical protein